MVNFGNQGYLLIGKFESLTPLKSEETGRIKNFTIADGFEEGEHEGIFFNDFYLFKIIEEFYIFS